VLEILIYGDILKSWIAAVSGPAIFFASGMNACSLNAWIHSDSGDLSPIQVALDASPT